MAEGSPVVLIGVHQGLCGLGMDLHVHGKHRWWNQV